MPANGDTNARRVDVYEAARRGCLGDLKSEHKRLKQSRESWPDWVGSTLAQYGHKEVLNWACKHGCPVDMWTRAHATLGGHLKVLKWLHKQQCPMDEQTCAWAAKGGHFEILEWARANSCP